MFARSILQIAQYCNPFLLIVGLRRKDVVVISMAALGNVKLSMMNFLASGMRQAPNFGVGKVTYYMSQVFTKI